MSFNLETRITMTFTFKPLLKWNVRHFTNLKMIKENKIRRQAFVTWVWPLPQFNPSQKARIWDLSWHIILAKCTFRDGKFGNMNHMVLPYGKTMEWLVILWLLQFNSALEIKLVTEVIWYIRLINNRGYLPYNSRI